MKDIQTDSFGVPVVEPIAATRKVSQCRFWRHKWWATGAIYRDVQWRVNRQEFQCLVCNCIKYKDI